MITSHDEKFSSTTLGSVSQYMKKGRYKMVNQRSDVQNSNIIESMNQAFDNGSFYGLEYVLDELESEKPAALNQNTVDWFGATDYFA